MRTGMALLAAALAAATLLPGGAGAAEEKPSASATPGAGKRVLLSRHETIAEFSGLENVVCHGRTAACPNDCGNSGTCAKFRVVRYLAYEKPGQYGDPKAETFVFMLHDNKGKPKVAVAVRDAVLALKPGDRVLLSWNHDYVTRTWPSGGTSSAPDRPITKLERAPAGGAEPAPVEPAAGLYRCAACGKDVPESEVDTLATAADPPSVIQNHKGCGGRVQALAPPTPAEAFADSRQRRPP